jgi:ribonuclease Y
MSITNLILALAAAAIGGGIGYFFRKQIAQTRANTVEAIAEKKLIEAKNKEQELLLQAKEKAIKIIDDAKKEEEDRRNELRQIQSRLEQRENMFDKKITEFEDEKTKVQQEKEQTKALREKIQEIQQEALKKLQTISGLSMDDAKNVLLKKVEEESKNDLMARIIKFEKDNHEELEARAQDIMVCCMQRTASSHAAETTSTVINLASDDMKGRIIGKEGRNIKTLEKLTGCELIIDETPDILLVSSFSPIRRRVCQLALEKLMKDGRIQPAKIEEYVEEAKKELALDLKKAGEEALHKMGIVGMDPKLVSIIGRLKYRTSYGQNVLMHCMEVGTLAALMAEEVGMDPGKARKAGFFHDIGKSVDHDTQGTHTQIGHTILKKFGVGDEIAEVALTHHDTNPPLLLTKLVMAADAISASRVGARRDTFEQYVARLEELEAVAKDFPGVDKVYAIQAGREVRVFVNPNEADEYQVLLNS